MLADLTAMNPADLAGVGVVWFLGLVFLAMNAAAICSYLKKGR